MQVRKRPCRGENKISDTKVMHRSTKNDIVEIDRRFETMNEIAFYQKV